MTPRSRAPESAVLYGGSWASGLARAVLEAPPTLLSRLLIVVPRSRRACGRATFVAADGSPLIPPMRILATASASVAKKQGNPTRDRLLPFGHPPQGTYTFAGSLPPGERPKSRRARRYGAVGAILVVGTGGEALEATRKGRRMFHLHGGPSDRKGRLRPTRGGFRMQDGDLTRLLRAINDAQLRGDPLQTVDVLDVVLPPGPRAPAERVLTRKRRRRTKRRRTAKKLGQAKRGGIPPLGLAVALAAKLLGARKPDVRARVSRRDVVALALLITGVAACGTSDRRERPSRCEPVSCDPHEGLCPPQPACWSGGGTGGGSSGGTVDDSGGDG